MTVSAQVGDRFRLVGHIGYQKDIDPNDQTELAPGVTVAMTEALRDRHYPLFEDQIGVVDEIVPAEVDGAGTKDEDHVVLSFVHHELVDHTPGKEVPDHRATDWPRRCSFTQAQLDDTSMFEKLPDRAQGVYDPYSAADHVFGRPTPSEVVAKREAEALAATGGAAPTPRPRVVAGAAKEEE